ncbi:MAG: APC family permease [Bryobacteraceae bacterium]
MGRWSMTALVVNSVIGVSIFGLPSELIRLLGWASPVAVFLTALLISIIAACMAEVASRFTEAGGAYLYVRSAFGRFAGLQVGWFWLLASLGGGAGCANLFVQYLSGIWPPASTASVRIGIMALLIAVPTAANYVGVRTGTNLSTILTIAKLVPLCLLAVLGLAHFSQQPHVIPAIQFTHPGTAWLKAFLLLIFAYSGFENTLAPGGEVKEPRRTIPFALATGLLACAAVYTAIQFVTVATIGTNAAAHPLAVTDVSSVLLGRAGSMFVAFGVMISSYGWISGDILTSPRIIYSLAATGDAPAFLARLHPRFKVPAFALVVYATLEWALAVTGTFLWVAAVAAASILILYSGVCASLIRLRRLQPDAQALRVPFGPALAVVAIFISLALISTLDLLQILLISVTALIATANWWWAKRQEISKTSKIAAVSVP